LIFPGFATISIELPRYWGRFLDVDFRVVGGGPTGVEVAADLADFLAGDAEEAWSSDDLRVAIPTLLTPPKFKQLAPALDLCWLEETNLSYWEGNFSGANCYNCLTPGGYPSFISIRVQTSSLR